MYYFLYTKKYNSKLHYSLPRNTNIAQSFLLMSKQGQFEALFKDAMTQGLLLEGDQKINKKTI